MNYRIIRFFQTDEVGRKLIATGLTLAEAQAHCADPETSSDTALAQEALARTQRYGPWFDGYERDGE